MPINPGHAIQHVALWQWQDGLIACRGMVRTMNRSGLATKGHIRDMPVFRILYNNTIPCTSGNFITTKTRFLISPRMLSNGCPALYERCVPPAQSVLQANAFGSVALKSSAPEGSQAESCYYYIHKLLGAGLLISSRAGTRMALDRS